MGDGLGERFAALHVEGDGEGDLAAHRGSGGDVEVGLDGIAECGGGVLVDAADLLHGWVLLAGELFPCLISLFPGCNFPPQFALGASAFGSGVGVPLSPSLGTEADACAEGIVYELSGSVSGGWLGGHVSGSPCPISLFTGCKKRGGAGRRDAACPAPHAEPNVSGGDEVAPCKVVHCADFLCGLADFGAGSVVLAVQFALVVDAADNHAVSAQEVAHRLQTLVPQEGGDRVDGEVLQLALLVDVGCVTVAHRDCLQQAAADCCDDAFVSGVRDLAHGAIGLDQDHRLGAAHGWVLLVQLVYFPDASFSRC